MTTGSLAVSTGLWLSSRPLSVEAETVEARHALRAFHEIKFLLLPDTAHRVAAWARARLRPDVHGRGADHDVYITRSIYFDTQDFDVFARRGSSARAKYRLRAYDTSRVVFLERKLRTPAVLVKRRTAVPIADVGRLQWSTSSPGWPGNWFHRRLCCRALRPACQVSYQRLARVSATASGPLRLTLDTDLRAVAPAGLRFTTAAQSAPMHGGAVLELKYAADLPLVFKQLVAEFRLSPVPFSKYRWAMTTLRV
jgi:hypothetical protein